MKNLPLFKWDRKRGICTKCELSNKKVRYYAISKMGDFNKLVVDCLNDCFKTHLEFFVDKSVEEMLIGKEGAK